MVEPSKTMPHKSAVGLFGFHTIYGANGEHDTPYMTRAWIGRLRLHIFHRGDADPDCHDHPWGFWTFPLTSYVEEVAEPWPFLGPNGEARFSLRRVVVRAFRLHYRPATHCHRVIGRATPAAIRLADGPGHISRHSFLGVAITNDRKIITFVWRTGPSRKWGFLKNRDGKWCWTPWKEYVFNGGKHAPCEPTPVEAESNSIADRSIEGVPQ